MKTQPNAERAARIIGCTVEQARAQYARTAESLREMAADAKASRSGMCNGYTHEYLTERADLYARVGEHS